jgi:hypothetical protein
MATTISTKAEALDVLEDVGGHAYLTPDAALAIAAAFGLTIRLQRMPANTGEFKGLEVAGAKPGERIEGYAARDLAEAIAESLPDPLPRVYRILEGRGSRARAACETIRAHLVTTGEVGS